MIWIIKLSLLFNSSPSKPKSDPKIFPDAPALLQPPPGSSCQVVHLLSAPQLACWITKGGGTSSLVYNSYWYSYWFPPHLLYCILSSLTPPISFLLFIRIWPLKFSMLTRSVTCLSRLFECRPVIFMVKFTSNLPL